jgi:hypothetical protein
MHQPRSFPARFALWFALYLVLDAALVGLMWVSSKYGGVGQFRNTWIVGLILLVGAALAARSQARKPLADAAPKAPAARTSASTTPSRPRTSANREPEPRAHPTKHHARKKH